MRELILRYAFSRSDGHRARVIRIIITLTLSLLVLVAVLAIMDYLQGSRFEDIKNVRSFSVVADGDEREYLKSLYPDADIFIYGEGEALIEGRAYLVRFIDDEYDGGLRFLKGDSSSLVIPYSLYREYRKDDYSVTMMMSGKSGRRLPKTEEINISGIYSTSLGQEFDSLYVFMPLSLYEGAVKTALKGDVDLSKIEDIQYTTWKDSESSLYSAFILEKTMMYSVISLLFVIILVSERQSVSIFFRSKEKERAELIVLGMERRKASSVFIMSFMAITIISIALAFILSLLLLPMLEHIISLFIFGDVSLSIPYGGFAVFSFISLFITYLFTLFETAKEKKKDLMEVIHG